MSDSNNRALRTSVWVDLTNNLNLEIVYQDIVSHTKWSVRVGLTPEQAASLAQRLITTHPKEVPDEAA